MKSLLPTPRRLLTLDALFTRRRTVRIEPMLPEDTRLPDAADPRRLLQAHARMARLAAEMALEEGSRRQYAARDESVVVEKR